MKTFSSSYNPLDLLITYIGNKTNTELDYDDVHHIIGFLIMGGVCCENTEEVVQCLKILDEIGVIGLEENRENNKIFYNVTKRYNGK